jgi:hypothetical protein
MEGTSFCVGWIFVCFLNKIANLKCPGPRILPFLALVLGKVGSCLTLAFFCFVLFCFCGTGV